MAACSSMESPEQEEASGLPDMSGSIDFLASTFLADTHYKRIHCALATKWDKLQSLSAAMKLMEQHGVHLTEAEIEKLSRMDEMQQINALVMKMPQQSNEQFQRFFLQLQLLVSSATQIPVRSRRAVQTWSMRLWKMQATVGLLNIFFGWRLCKLAVRSEH